jgi:hypothetical protein
LSRDVALLKLEQKFKQAMLRIEELLGEKEHLVRLSDFKACVIWPTFLPNRQHHRRWLYLLRAWAM